MCACILINSRADFNCFPRDCQQLRDFSQMSTNDRFTPALRRAACVNFVGQSSEKQQSVCRMTVSSIFELNHRRSTN
jgi:hypothetical protein